MTIPISRLDPNSRHASMLSPRLLPKAGFSLEQKVATKLPPFRLVGPTRLELATSCTPCKRATNCATARREGSIAALDFLGKKVYVDPRNDKNFCYDVRTSMKLIFATHNSGKVKEMRQLLADCEVEVASADEAGISEDVIEDGTTFAENALKKARFVAQKSGQWAVADDSGVCIWAIGCMPGIHTARWAGEGASDEQIVAYALEQLKNVPEGKRNAWFESAVALVAPDGSEQIFEGKVEGRIASEPLGTPRRKLPYDVLFIPDGYEQTFAEMPDDLKNHLSHRGRAFAKLKEFLKTV